MKHAYRTVVLVGALGAIVIAGWVALPWINRAREAAGPRCSSNMRQLGYALTIYANENHARLPDTLEEMLASIDITNHVLICPSCNDEIAAGNNASEVIANIRARGLPARIEEPATRPRHCSYIYLGKGLSKDALTPATVVVVEPLANHDGDGINVLYGDGRVEFINAAKAKGLIHFLPSASAASSMPAATSQEQRR
jgi:prepilin-type processing-associated H-X9-DG protein